MVGLKRFFGPSQSRKAQVLFTINVYFVRKSSSAKIRTQSHIYAPNTGGAFFYMDKGCVRT
jgi:hypothetical protein